MRQSIQPRASDLPIVLGARRLLAGGKLGAELVRLSQAAAELDRERAATLTVERPLRIPDAFPGRGVKR